MHVSGTVARKRPREEFLELGLSQIALNPITSEFNVSELNLTIIIKTFTLTYLNEM